ncbi:MAG: thiamine pyrophosphate-binding protein [Firmicutes bacterium]|nr:thiamine pyrophosphate-binding protein [Bacillota bacterium]
MRVYELIAKTMRDEGVTDVFGLMGHGNMEVVTHMVKECGLNYVAVRQENAAVAAAAGFSHTSGRVGVATTNHGPGFTNAVTALTSAVKAHAPVVFFVNDPPSKGGGHNTQGIDHAGIAQIAGAGFEYVRYAEHAAYQTAKAFRRAKAERRPIVLNFVPELFHEEGAPAPVHYGDLADQQRLSPDPRAVQAAADLIERAQRPIVLAGLGAFISGARPELERLGERIGALMASTLRGKGFFNGNPYDLGIAGGFASHLAKRYMAQADCVISFGAAMKRLTMYRFAADATFIHCDRDERVFDTYWPAACWIQGDAKASAGALLAELERRGVRKAGFRTQGVAEEIAAYSRATEFEEASTGAAVDPRTAMLEIDPLLPVERTLIVDSGLFQGWPPMFMSVPDPAGFIFAHDFGSVGLALGHAIGAYLGRPDRRPIVAIGDGGFMMSLQEFETAARYRIPLIVLVMNDHAYGAEVAVLRRQGNPPDLAFFQNPSFEEVARALGGSGFTVRSRADIKPAVMGALECSDGPSLIDIHINGDIVPEWLATFTFLEALRP